MNTKSIRTILIISGVIALISLGVVVYMMFWGPDHLELGGKSLSELLKSGALTPIIVIPIALIIAGVTIVPFLRIMFPSDIKNGVTAPAKVLEVWDTGVSINDNPQVGLLLEVSPPNGTPFQVKAKSLVSRLNVALVQPGITAEVKYDPLNPKRIKVLTVNIQSAASSDAASRLEQLEELRNKDLISGDEYRQKREEILKSL